MLTQVGTAVVGCFCLGLELLKVRVNCWACCQVPSPTSFGSCRCFWYTPVAKLVTYCETIIGHKLNCEVAEAVCANYHRDIIGSCDARLYSLADFLLNP